MKKLLLSLAAVVFASTSFAAHALNSEIVITDLSDISLKDYVITTPGESWTYTNEDSTAEQTTISEVLVENIACTIEPNCARYIYTSDDVSSTSTFKVEDDNVYYSEIFGVKINPVLSLSKQPFSYSFDETLAKIYGIPDEIFQEIDVQISCELNRVLNYDFNDQSYDVIRNLCMVEGQKSDSSLQILLIENYAKNIGQLDSYSLTAINDAVVKESFLDLQTTTLPMPAKTQIKSAIKFSDLKEGEHHFEPVMWLTNEQIINGYPDGTFKAFNTLNRAELLKIVVGGLGVNVLSGEKKTNCFTDVHDEWFAPYVCYAKEKGWVKGYADGGFHPAQQVSRVEALKMLIEPLRYQFPLEPKHEFNDVPKASWFNEYVAVADTWGLLQFDQTGKPEAGEFAPQNEMLRGEFSYWLYLLLTLPDPSGLSQSAA